MTDWELFRIGRAVKLGCIRLVFSYLNVEETLFIVPSQPRRAEARVKLMLELADKKLVVRGHQLTINRDIRAYAHGLPIDSPFEPLTPWMESEIWRLAAPIGKDIRALDRVLKKTRRIKDEYQDFMINARKHMKPLTLSLASGLYPFESYLKNNSVWLAEGLAKRAKALGKVKKRGIPGMLNLKSVAIAVGANLSLIYSHLVEGHAPRSGDSRDVLHGLAASSADVFVTNDRQCYKILRRVPVGGFKVMNLAEFLVALPNWI